ncbi:DUF4097 domain-containing protein [Actinoplanes sp. TBRC 11911]|uniref:DUF4097 family beta strand repeat-containing protein n=1 Tax=Actinoplanes sp. TBRC 11911 TaxID=2729386 RepID=UPI00145C6A11|nr:DUF4097 family beta strand repeat-containing protein [Actinoplanes sp. TBRC 11911]NMO55955.1 DUF4097 domain-containing protein [Actinoplanes sp. TBRC 11911]
MTTTFARRAGILAVATAAATTLTGCAGVLGAKMTYEDSVKTKITEIRVNGGSGDVVVNTGAVADTAVKRVVRGTANPGDSYRMDGSSLVLDTSCGRNCSVSYEITAPANVAVSGELRSGNILLTGVGTTDLQLTSGDVTVREPTGPVKVRGTSGDIRVLDAKSTVTVQTTSGDIEALNAAGAVDLKVTSGDINAELSAPNPVRAQTTSGDVNVRVPAGSYRVSTDTGSGDEALVGITNDPAAKNTIDVRTGSGDATVTAR